MNNLVKKSFLVSMIVLTALFGVAVDVNADVAAGLYKSNSSSAVYYVDSNGVKHPFTHAREYATWYQDFSGVANISTDEMVSYTLGSAVALRPGARLLQFIEVVGATTWSTANTPEVYAVGTDNMLYKLDSAAAAAALYGANWASQIVPVPNYSAGNYSISSTVLTASSMYPTGTLVKTSGSSQVYYVEGNMIRPVNDNGANRFNMNYVVTASSLAGYSTGSSITGYESALADPVTGSGSGSQTPTGSGLTVRLASNTPAGTIVPKGASGVKVATYDVTASADGAVNITSLKIKRSGIGAYSDISKAYVFDGNTRLTTGRNLNSDGIASMNLNYTVPAGTTKQLSIVIDLAASPTVSNNHNFRFTDISSAASVTYTETAGSTFTIGGASVGSFTVNTNAGTTATDIKVGQDSLKLADFDFDTIENEDISLSRIVLTNGGSATASDISSLVLKYNGNTLAEGSYDGELMTFEFSPLTLEKDHSNYNFKVYADIEGGINNTIKLYVDEKSDITAVGKEYGYNANITHTAIDQSSESYPLTITGGEITVNFKTDKAETIIGDQEDYVFATLEITAPEEIDVKELRVSIAETDGSDGGAGVIDIDNLELHYVQTGSVYDGTASSDSDTTDNDPGWDYTNIGWPEGTSTWEIRGDLPAAASSSADTYVISINFSANFTAEYQVSNEAITAASNLSVTTLTGKTKTLGTASLKVIPTTLQNGQGVINATDVVLADGKLQAGSNSEVTVTSIAFHGNDDSTTTGSLVADVDDGYLDKTNISRIRLMADLGNGWVELDSKTGGSLTNGEVTFDSFDYDVVVPKDGTVNFRVLTDIAGTLDAASTTLRIQTTSVTATDNNNSSVSATDVSGTAVDTTHRIDYGTTVSLFGNAKLTAAMDNTISPINKNRYVLAGTDNVPISRLKFTTLYEPVVVTQIVVSNDTAAYADSVSNVEIADANGNVVATLGTLDSGTTATSTNDNGLFTIPVGTSYYTIRADIAAIGYGQGETADSGDVLAMYLATTTAATTIKGHGANTGVTLTANDFTSWTAHSDTNYNSTVLGTRIDSVEDLTDETLTSGQQEIFRFRINLDDTMKNGSTNNYGEELRMHLEEFKIKVTYTGAMSTTATTSDNEYRLYRVGGSGYVSTVVETSGSTAWFDLVGNADSTTAAWESSLVANTEIDVDNNYAEFYLVATNVELGSITTDDSIQCRLETLDGSASSYSIKYHDGSGTSRYDLLSGTNDLVGEAVTP